MALDEGMEEIAMCIIASAGAARGAAFEALSEAKKQDFARADALMQDADDYALEAHKAHSELLRRYASGEFDGGDILLSHAQDHLMCAALAKELIAEIVLLRRELCAAH